MNRSCFCRWKSMPVGSFLAFPGRKCVRQQHPKIIRRTATRFTTKPTLPKDANHPKPLLINTLRTKRHAAWRTVATSSAPATSPMHNCYESQPTPKCWLSMILPSKIRQEPARSWKVNSPFRDTTDNGCASCLLEMDQANLTKLIFHRADPMIQFTNL